MQTMIRIQNIGAILSYSFSTWPRTFRFFCVPKILFSLIAVFSIKKCLTTRHKMWKMCWKQSKMACRTERLLVSLKSRKRLYPMKSDGNIQSIARWCSTESRRREDVVPLDNLHGRCWISCNQMSTSRQC